MCCKNTAKWPVINCLLVLCYHAVKTSCWITLSKQGLIINKTHLSLQSSAQVEGDLLIKGVIHASDYTWISSQDNKNQDVCNSNNIGALRWRNSTSDYFEACDGTSGLWRQVKFCDKDCGFPEVPLPSLRTLAEGGPTNCQSQVCVSNCSFHSVNEKQFFILNLLGISPATIRQQCNLILESNSSANLDENSTNGCANITIGRFYSFTQQSVPGFFPFPEEIMCFTTSSTTCRSENCTDRTVQDLGWTNQKGISSTRWILLKDPILNTHKLARENGLYYFQGILYPMSITVHDLITFEDPGVQIWPTASVAKLPLELWRQDYQANLGSVDAPFRGSPLLFQRRIPSVFDQGAPLRPDSALGYDTLTCAAFDFAAPAFDYLRVFYNVSGWERLLPANDTLDDSPPDALVREPELLRGCVGGFRRVFPPPFWLLVDRDAAANTSWVGSVASGPAAVCFNGTCAGMNCSLALPAPPGFAVQVLVGLDLDAQLAHRGDRFTLVERTANGSEIVLLDRLGVDDNATEAEPFNASAAGNGTNATADPAAGCGVGGGPCAPAGGPPASVLIRTTRFGSTLIARFQSTSRSDGRGFNLTYGYVPRLSLLRRRGNTTLLQLALAVLEAQGADGRGFGWERAANEVLVPAPAGAARLGNATDAEGCFLCFFYNGSCLGSTACDAPGCGGAAALGGPVEGGPTAPPWTADPPGPAEVGATGPLAAQFSARVSAGELPAVAAYMGYSTEHYVRTMHVSAFPPGTVKAPYAAVLGQRPAWGPYGDKDPSTAGSHPQREAVGWGLRPVLFGSGDLPQVQHLRENLFGTDGEFPGEAGDGVGAQQPEWQILVPEASVGFVSARRWLYDLDSELLPPFSFVDADRRVVTANELAMFVPCGMPINNTCGVPCLVYGTALNMLQCGAAVPETSCNEPVVDLCNNECGLLGTRMCDASAADAGALRIGSLGNSSSVATFQLTTQYDDGEGSSALYLSMHDPTENCNVTVSGFDPASNACYYTDHGTKIPYQLTPVQLRLLVSREDLDIPVPAECQSALGNILKTQSCKFNDPLDMTAAPLYRWKRNGQTANASIPWWDLVPDKRASWTELRGIVSSTRNSRILEVIYVEDMATCRDRCALTFGSTSLACRAHCLVALTASLMLTFGVDTFSLQPCVLYQKPENTPYKSGLWPTGTVNHPPTASWPALDRLCTISACTEFFPTCYVSINNILKMTAMFEARRRTMMVQINNRPGFNLAKIKRLTHGRTGIDIASPSNIPANKPQARIENTLRISFLQQIFEKDVLIGNGPLSRIFIDAVIDQECPLHFDPTINGDHTMRWCYHNSSTIGATNTSTGRKNRTITIPDISGRLLTTQTLQDLTSLPGLRKRKTLTVAGTSYPRYGIWPLPRFAKIPDPFSQGGYLTEESQNTRPFQGLDTRYCGLREDGMSILCERLKQEYDTLEDLSNQGDESMVYTSENLIFRRVLNSTSRFNSTVLTPIWENATTSILFFDPTQHQKLTVPDASSLLISSGNLEKITKTGVLVSPIVAYSSESTVTRLKFGVGWESVNVSSENNALFYRYTEGSFSFCRSSNFLPKIVISNSWIIPNFEQCNQGDAILFEMGQEWDVELPLDRPDRCLSMYITSKPDQNVTMLPEVDSTVTLTSTYGISNAFSVTSIHRVCQNNIIGLGTVTDECASSSVKVSFSDPNSQSVIVSNHNFRYVVCASDMIKNFSSMTIGTWSLTRYRSVVLESGIYSLENVTRTVNSMLLNQLRYSQVRLSFNIRDPKEGLCAERPVGTTYNFSFFHCGSASRFIELHGEILYTTLCNTTSSCGKELDTATCPIVCQNVSDPGSNIQVLNSSTILETFAIEKPIFAYTFATLSHDPAGAVGFMHPIAPGSGYVRSGYGRMSGLGLGGTSSWTGNIPPDPIIAKISYTRWCHDGLGFLCIEKCSCETAVITFSQVLGSTRTKNGNSPVNNSLLIPRTAHGLLISTGNLEDVFLNSSAVTSLHVNALHVHQTAIGAIIGQRLEFRNSSGISFSGESSITPQSGLQLVNNTITFHSFHYMTSWIAIYSPDGQCPAQIFRAIDSNDNETIWNILANKSFCANKTFSSLQDSSSQNASKYACLAYCSGVDSTKEQESVLARQQFTEINSDGSNAVDFLLEDPTSYCISVTCNGTTSIAPNLTINFYVYRPDKVSSAGSDPYLAAQTSRKPCTVVCTNRARCSTQVKDTLAHRPPQYDFSHLPTIQAWDTCVRMMELESKFSPSVLGTAVNARASFDIFQTNFAVTSNRFNLAIFALQQRCSCVELEGYSSATTNGLKDVLEHSCQTDNNPVCVSEGNFQRFPSGLPWQTHLQFTQYENDEREKSVRFLVVPFVSAIVLTNRNLDAITVGSGGMTSVSVDKSSHFNSSIKIGMIREGQRGKAASQGSRKSSRTGATDKSFFGPFNECAGCVTAGTCHSVCANAVNQLVLNNDGIHILSDVALTGLGNASSLSSARSTNGLYQIRFPAWDEDLCNQQKGASCTARTGSDLSLALFTGTIITTGNLNDIDELNPNFLHISGNEMDIPAIMSGPVEIGSKFSCISGNISGYGRRGWSIYSGAGCAEQDGIEGKIMEGSVLNCRKACESDPLCGVLIVNKIGKNGLDRSGGQVCSLVPLLATQCTLVGRYNQDLYLNFREAPSPWTKSQASNQFFNNICSNANLSFVPGTPISFDGYLSSGITWRPQQPYSWKYFPSSMCDTFNPLAPSVGKYISRIQNFISVEYCKGECMARSDCGMVSVHKDARICYLLSSLLNRRILANASDSCGGRESVFDLSVDAASKQCILQGRCSVKENPAADLYVFFQNQGITLKFTPPSRRQTINFPDATGVVVTTGNLYDITSLEGLQGSDVFNYTDSNYSFFSASQSQFWSRYNGPDVQLRTFKSSLLSGTQNYMKFSGSKLISTRSGKPFGNVILRECDFSPPQTSLWKVDNPSFSRSGLPDRDCLAKPGCVMFTNILDTNLLNDAQSSLTQERKLRPGLAAQPTSFRNTYIGTGDGFDSFSYILDFSRPGSRISNTTCLRNCAGGTACDRAIGYLPCERGTLGCHAKCPGYMYPRPGVDTQSPCAGKAVGNYVSGSPCGCPGGGYFQNPDGNTFGTAVCIIPNKMHGDNGRFCIPNSIGSRLIPKGWISAEACCRNKSDAQNCGVCTEFPPFPPEGDNNRITFPDTSGTVITTGNMDDLTVLTLQLDNLVISGSLDLGVISKSKTPTFGPQGYHFDSDTGTNGIWRTAINLDPFTTKVLGGLPLVSGIGSPGNEYIDPSTGETFAGSGQFYPLTRLVNSPVADLTGSSRNDVIHFCKDSVAFPQQQDVNSLMDERERTGPTRCGWKREILLPSTGGVILIDTMLDNLSSVSIPRQSLLLQEGGFFARKNLTLGYRHNYTSDPVNSASFTSFPKYHGLGITGLELSEPQDVVPFQQPYQSVLRAYVAINGDIGLTFLSASNIPVELPQSREVQSVPDYGKNCPDSTCSSFSSTHYGSAAPTAEVRRFAADGRSTDNRQRRFQDNTVQISPAHMSGIDVVLRRFLREGAPKIRSYVQEGDGVVVPGGIYAGRVPRPTIQTQRTILPFISESMIHNFVNATYLPRTPKMLSETIVITKQFCYSKFMHDDVPKSPNGAVNRNSLYSLLLMKKVVILDSTGRYTFNESAVMDQSNLDTAVLLKCAALGYYPMLLDQNVTEIALPESNGYILTTGSLEDISMLTGNVTSLSISEDLTVDGSLVIGSTIHASKLTIHSSIDMNVGLRFAGPFDSDSTTYLRSGSSTEDSFIFLPDTFGTLVAGDLPSTLKSLDMLEDGDLLFESSVKIGSDSSIGGIDQNTMVTLHSVLRDPCPLRFARSADSAAQIALCLKEPSADNTIFLPEESGTLMTSSQLTQLDNITIIEKISVQGESLVFDTDIRIGGFSSKDILELNANIMGSNFLTFDGIRIKDGRTLVLSAADPGAQNEITLPDCSGTVITSGNFPTVFERLRLLDDFWTKGDTLLTGDNIIIGSRDSLDATLIRIHADLIGEYPLVFDGLSEPNELQVGACQGVTKTSLMIQQSGGENIITFPDTSGIILTSASLPSTMSTESDYTIQALGIAVYSNRISFVTGEPKECSGCFIFEDMNSNVTSLMQYADNTFTVTATGGAHFFTGSSSAGNYIGASLMPNSGSWSYLSDENCKQNILRINTTDMLKLLVEKVPISIWYYTDDPLQTRHMGPYAQDFEAAFHLGSDMSRIVASDADGVILGAIQGMHVLIDETRREKKRLQTLLAELHIQMEAQNNRLEEQARQMSQNNDRVSVLLLLLHDSLDLTT